MSPIPRWPWLGQGAVLTLLLEEGDSLSVGDAEEGGWEFWGRKTRHRGHCYRPLNTMHTQSGGWGEPRVTEATVVLSGAQAAIIGGAGLAEAWLLVEAPQLDQ